MTSLLDAWMGPVWVSETSWLTLASLRALVVCFTSLVVVKGLRRPARRASYGLYMAGSTVILAAFLVNFSYSVAHDSHPMLTYNALLVDVGIILCMVGALYNDGRLREAQGLEPRSNLHGLTKRQKRVSLSLGVLGCAFAAGRGGIQLLPVVVGVLLALVYLLPDVDDE